MNKSPSVKQAIENAREELDRKWREKYPHGEMRIYIAIEHVGTYPNWQEQESWVAEIHAARPTSRTRLWRGYNANGKMADPPWHLRQFMKKIKKFSDPEKFIAACNAVGICLTQQEINRLQNKL